MDIEQARYNMIEQQIRPWDVLDPRVLAAVKEIPREDFVPPRYRSMAFADMNIPLDHDQVMMSPKVEARLLQELSPIDADTVLEIGTGSGYVTALLAHLAAHVDSVDIFPDFIESAQAKLDAHGLDNVTCIEGDACAGWSGDASYDAILITGSLPELPDSFTARLKTGGRLVAILGEAPIMEACLVQRADNDALSKRSLFDTFIPALVNATPPPKFVF